MVHIRIWILIVVLSGFIKMAYGMPVPASDVEKFDEKVTNYVSKEQKREVDSHNRSQGRNSSNENRGIQRRN